MPICVTDCRIHSLKLEAWMSKLAAPLRIPPQLTKPPAAHTIMLNALYYFVTILLYRPYYNQTDQLAINEIAVKKCNAASARIISLFEVSLESMSAQCGKADQSLSFHSFSKYLPDSGSPRSRSCKSLSRRARPSCWRA